MQHISAHVNVNSDLVLMGSDKLTELESLQKENHNVSTFLFI